MAVIGYARVSTEDQNLELQIDALERHGCESSFYRYKRTAILPYLDR